MSNVRLKGGQLMSPVMRVVELRADPGGNRRERRAAEKLARRAEKKERKP